MTQLLNRTYLLILLTQIIHLGLSAQLTTTITNIKEVKGRIELGLYNDPEVFLSETEQYKVLYVPVENKLTIITIDSIPEGTYAISLMHDLNSDGKMEKNFIQYPQEPYGFSNNIKPRFSKPEFEDCKFYYNGISLRLTIELID